jgi:hypothetical protein
MKKETWFAPSVSPAGLELPRPLSPATFSTPSGVLRFPGLYLGFKRLVLFRQRIAGRRHGFEIVSQLAVLFLEFGHLSLQLLVLLQGFCVLAGNQGQTQQHHRSQSRPSVFVRHASSFIDKNVDKNLIRNWNNR